MSYKDTTAKAIIEQISANKIYLPAIQRKFVWDSERIEGLFDSIMRGYPIGTFLFWMVKDEKVNEYTFYKFIQEFHERDNFLNQIAPKPELKNEIIGVLDGQQRLSSLYIALQGTYSYKKPYAHWSNNDAFPKRKLYLNIFRDPNQQSDESYIYQFKFLTHQEASIITPSQLWFLVKDVLSWSKSSQKNEYYNNLINMHSSNADLLKTLQANKSTATDILDDLWDKLTRANIISYFEIQEQELDNILDIFVRVNSGGVPLSKSDLLFSTIVANWEDGREQIDDFIKTLNKQGDGFRFDSDFIMRSALVLTNSPVLFKVSSFKKENIDKIKYDWDSIRTALLKTVELLVKFGFSGETLTSYNAIIPIAYYIVKGGTLTPITEKEIRKYLIHSLLKQIYGSQGDQTLAKIRSIIDSLILTGFSFDTIAKNLDLSGDKSLFISDADIEDILEYRKGANTFMVLSLLYPNFKFSQVKFHQDHIHPATLFTPSKLKKLGIDDVTAEVWIKLKDTLPNLQLLEGSENESKNKTPFYEWLHGNTNGTPNIADVAKFEADNYIPSNTSYDISNFEIFFKLRKNILKCELKKILK